MRGGGFEIAETAMRNSEWAAVIGECGRYRMTTGSTSAFAPMSGPKSVLRVQKFLSHFHKPIPNALKGQFLNIWDWFGTGFSAYWYPGEQALTIPL
jgi:hypothetical protein